MVGILAVLLLLLQGMVLLLQAAMLQEQRVVGVLDAANMCRQGLNIPFQLICVQRALLVHV